MTKAQKEKEKYFCPIYTVKKIGSECRVRNDSASMGQRELRDLLKGPTGAVV